MKTKKLMKTVLILVAAMLVLGLSGNVQAVTEPERQIAADFEESFVNAICTKYNITKEQFTWQWASEQKELNLSNMSIGGIDKGGRGESVLTTYFCNLEALDVSNNDLGGLPNLPNTLKKLNCANNNIKGLPNLTPILTELDCSNNKIAELPNLSGVLEKLNCSNNELKALPTLPGTLVNLDASNNELPGLPDLPGTLVTLNLANNELPGLPDLPATLVELNLANNKLPGLPYLPETLKSLDVSNNELPGLPNLPETLTTLNIKGNDKITAIASEQLPAGLTNFESDLVKNSDGDYTVDGKDIRYTITIEKFENGTVKIDKVKVLAGKKVAIEAIPDEGYRLKEITGVDGLVNVSEYGYEFTMPNKDVTLSVAFEKIETSKEEEKTEEKDETPKTGVVDVTVYAVLTATVAIAGIAATRKMKK